MRSIKAACDELVGRLEGAGFRASIDPEALVTDPGCVWVQPRQVRGYDLAGGGTLVCWLYLIIANLETPRAMELLDDSLEGVLELGLSLSDTDEAIDLAAAVILPNDPTTPLPAYRLAVDLDL